MKSKSFLTVLFFARGRSPLISDPKLLKLILGELKQLKPVMFPILDSPSIFPVSLKLKNGKYIKILMGVPSRFAYPESWDAIKDDPPLPPLLWKYFTGKWESLK